MLKKIVLPLGLLFALSSSVLASDKLPFQAVETIQKVEYELKDYRMAEMDRLGQIALEEREREQREFEETERTRIEEEKKVERVITYNPYDILTPSNLNEDEVYQMLEGSALQSLARAYVYMEELYGINLLFLVALNSEESARGESSLAISNNNLGGVVSRNGGWAYFSDWGDSLMYIAELLKTEYLSPEGNYYNGSSIWNINTRYCLLADGVTTDYNWSDNINAIAYEYLEKVK